MADWLCADGPWRRGAVRALIALACAAGVSLPAPSRADVDLTGSFVAESVIFGLQIICDLDIVQTGTALTASGTCDFVGAIDVAGTIDPVTGIFTASGTAAAICTASDSLVIAATATPDSSSFSGTVDCAGLMGSLFGSRCGNGQLDPGEVCDQGFLQNGVFGSCCSAVCQYQSPSVMCRNPFDCNPAEFCTGASGACPPDVQDPDGTPCGPTNPCVTGQTCTAGACGGGTPLPAGTSCAPPIECAAFECNGAGGCEFSFTTDPCDDGDVCTTNDACLDGYCQGGPAVDCGPCQACDSINGCFPAIDPTCRKPLSVSSPLAVKEGAAPSRNRIVWKWNDGEMTSPTDFGDPRTTTSYTVCVYDQDAMAPAGLRLMLSATAPAGGNWSPTSTGYRYKDTTLSPDGLRKILLRAGDDHAAKIVVTGKRDNLDLQSLPAQVPVTVQIKASTGQCWDAVYSTADSTPIRFKGKGGP